MNEKENLNVDAILQGLVRAKYDAISDYSKERIQNGIKLIIELANYNASAESRKTGKWLQINAGYYDYVKCSQCGETLVWGKNFCPNCGADMRGEEE